MYSHIVSYFYITSYRTTYINQLEIICSPYNFFYVGIIDIIILMSNLNETKNIQNIKNMAKLSY